MHAPFCQSRAQSGGGRRQLQLRGDIEQSADADGAVDHEATHAAQPELEPPLQCVVDHAVDFRKVAEKIVDTGANRRGNTTISVRHGQKHPFIESGVEAVGKSIQAFPGIIGIHGWRIRCSHQRRHKPGGRRGFIRTIFRPTHGRRRECGRAFRGSGIFGRWVLRRHTSNAQALCGATAERHQQDRSCRLHFVTGQRPASMSSMSDTCCREPTLPKCPP